MKKYLNILIFFVLILFQIFIGLFFGGHTAKAAACSAITNCLGDTLGGSTGFQMCKSNLDIWTCQSNGTWGNDGYSSVCASACTITGTSATPDGGTVYSNSIRRVFANGVSNATSVYFATWSDPGGQDDLIWYLGTNAGEGIWYADINMASHGAGAMNVHVYMNNLAFYNVFLDHANFISVPPLDVSISASPAPVAYNSPSTITWSSTSASSCLINHFGGVATSGAQGTGNLVGTSTYILTCNGVAGGSISRSVTISVGETPSPAPVPPTPTPVSTPVPAPVPPTPTPVSTPVPAPVPPTPTPVSTPVPAPVPTPTPTPTPTSGRSPIGWLDGITPDGVISGWALDPDNTAYATDVHIYFDGPAGTGTNGTAVNTNLSRPDVNAAHGITGNHGFNLSISPSLRDGKTHAVYAYGIDITGDAHMLLLGVPKFFFIASKRPIQKTTIQTNLISINNGQSVVLSWTAPGATKIILNPGNIDVTGQLSYVAAPQSDTLFNLSATYGTDTEIATVFVKSGPRLPKIAGLWIGPWYDPVNPWTITQLKNDFGANMVMYNLDWVALNYFNSTDHAYDLNSYISFCNARISEARSANVYIFWATILPFNRDNSADAKIKILNELKPCFDSPYVLGIHTIDEPQAQQNGNWTKESIREGYNLFKSVYPNKLVWMNLFPSGVFTGAPNIDEMLGWDWGDIVSLDNYVIPTSNLVGALTPWIQATKEIAGDRDAWFIHQAYGQTMFTGDLNQKPPTPDELQTMTNLTWDNGFTGLVWWGMVNNRLLPQHFQNFGIKHEFIPTQAFKDTLKSINTSIGLTPVITGISGGVNSIIIKAKGTSAQGVYPKMELRLGGTVLGSWNVSGDYADYTITTTQLISDNLRVYFTNDYFRGGEDRNLTVDYITVNGKAYQSEDSSTYAKGVYVSGAGCVAGFQKGKTLHCNNSYFEYPIIHAVSMAGSLIEAFFAGISSLFH